MKRKIKLVFSEIELDRKVEKEGGFAFSNSKKDVIVGISPGMCRLYKRIVQIADTINKKSNIFISGETGTGKEMVARALHAKSARSKKPFIPVSCADIPEKLAEDLFFGHERGSFTDAHMQHRGYFERANGGTLFLDEIGDLSISHQPNFLRVLEDREFTRVGGEQVIKLDIVIVSATNRDIDQLRKERLFREDLIFRLNQIPISIPPLRERKEDIPKIADFFIEEFCEQHQRFIKGIHSEAYEILSEYGWPGNVRELRSVIDYCVLHETSSYLLPSTLREAMMILRYNTKMSDNESALGTRDIGEYTAKMQRDYISQSRLFSLAPLPNYELDLEKELEEHEKVRMQQALDYMQGNQREAAKLLNMKKSTFNRKAKQYGLSQKQD